jgi:hypothetical protein
MYGPPADGPAIRPSRGWYGLSAVLLAAAVACVVLGIISFVSLFQDVDSFQRVKVPGQAQLTFGSAGNYLLYFEGPGMSSGRTGELRVQIQSAAGAEMAISRLHGLSENYKLNGHSGQAVGSVDIPRPGRYLISAGLATRPAPTDIAVGKAIGGSIVGGVVFILVAVLVLTPAGLAVGLITFFRRRRARARGPLGGFMGGPMGPGLPNLIPPPQGNTPGGPMGPMGPTY